MIRKHPNGDLPVIYETAYVDNTAIICGKVVVHENVLIGSYAVIRADEVDENGEQGAAVIGAHSNIQDGVVIHSTSSGPRTIEQVTPQTADEFLAGANPDVS